MKVLWLSSANTLCFEKGDRAYNGKGWIASLQNAVTEYAPEIELGVAFLSNEDSEAILRDGITYYKILRKSPKGLRKLCSNWTGGAAEEYGDRVKEIVGDFRPDIVQVFGCETKLAPAAAQISGIPVVAHIQGILSEYVGSFFPKDTGKADMVTRRTFFNEIILNNGFRHLFDDYVLRSAKEREFLRSLKYAMGRTDWDREAVSRYSGAEYFHVDEALRDDFTAAAGRWTPGERSAEGVRIASTISPVPYKGVDVILKASAALSSMGVRHIWNVAGISAGSDIVEIYEKKTGLNAERCGVRFCGVMEPDALAAMLLESDVYVHPAYIENSPNSVCEAQMLGMPVVAAASGGVPSLIRDGDTGVLVPVGDHESTARSIATLAAEPQKAAALGRNAAAAAAARHDPKKIASELTAVYRRILSDHLK